MECEHGIEKCAYCNDLEGTPEVLQALANSGIDTTCGACMEVAFTGVTTNAHTCPPKPGNNTYTILKVSHEVYDEIATKLKVAGYDNNTSIWDGNNAPVDLLFIGGRGIALKAVGERKEPPLLQCVDCKNTESPAGAMARFFNKGRCLHCGGWFKVVRA